MFSLGRQRPAMTGRLANLRDARVSLSQRLILIQHSTAPTPSKTKPLHRSTYFNFPLTIHAFRLCTEECPFFCSDTALPVLAC